MNERFSSARLIARVELAQEPDFSLGRVRIRPSSLEAIAQGWSETLEPRVMQVLVALARARDEVVSRDALIESCWAGRIVGEDAINRCMWRLRKLAKASGNAFSIETIARVGYRLKVAEAIACVPEAGASFTSGPNFAAKAPEVAARAQRCSICVLPFTNMSGDVEQEYFSDGISEDIITDLSKVSALAVVSRNSTFAFKGKNVDVPKVARELKVSHVLEGSVRKVGSRVRITANLIAGVTNEQLWAERYDRDLKDIFALQDEISEAIVKALKVALLPNEKKAIEKRGTDSVEAYNLFLMARHYVDTGNIGNARQEGTIIRLCTRAVEIDPGYAGAWALIALGQMWIRNLGGEGDGGLAAAEQALMLDTNLAEAHAVKASILSEDRRHEEAVSEIAVALCMNPESWEVNRQAARISYHQRRWEDAVHYYEKATALSEMDFSSPSMMIDCYTAMGDVQAARRAARISLIRAEKIIAEDCSNAAAISCGVGALVILGEAERAREWTSRALLIDPENMVMRYDFACNFASLKSIGAALDMLSPVLEKAGPGRLRHAKADPCLDSLRDHPRFKAMMAAAEARLEAEKANSAAPKTQ